MAICAARYQIELLTTSIGITCQHCLLHILRWVVAIPLYPAMPRASEVYPHRGLASKPYRMYTNRPLELVLPSSAIMFTHPPCKHMQTGRVGVERLTFQTAN